MGNYLIVWNHALIVIDEHGWVITPGGGMKIGDQIKEYRQHEGIQLDYLEIPGIPATRWEDK